MHRDSWLVVARVPSPEQVPAVNRPRRRHVFLWTVCAGCALATWPRCVAAGPAVVLLIGEDEYDTRHTLPAWSQAELEPQGFRVTVCQAQDDDGAPHDFPGLEALDTAQVLIVSVRRRTPRTEQLDRIRAFLARGGGLVGIRTASHAFDREAMPGHARWETFDRDVLGAHYLQHYGNKPPEGPHSWVERTAAGSASPLLTGLWLERTEVTSHLYKNAELAPGVEVLMEGGIVGREVREPVTWLRNSPNRVFYTSLGNPADFALSNFRLMLVRAVGWAAQREPTNN